MEIFFIIVSGILSRIIPHVPNMTAVGAMALYSGSKYSVWKATLILMVTMIVSDVIFGFHSVMWATYGSIFLSILLGRLLRQNKKVTPIIGVTFFSSLLFFLITNFAVWIVPGSMYSKTIYGLMNSYTMALPFFRNSLIGDVTYVAFYFYCFEYLVEMIKRFFKLNRNQQYI